MNFEKHFSGAYNQLYLWRIVRLMTMGWIMFLVILLSTRFSWLGVLSFIPLIFAYIYARKIGQIFITHISIHNNAIIIEWKDGNQTKTLNKPVSRCSVNIQSANLYKSKREMMKLKIDEIEIRQYEILGWKKLDFGKIKTKIDSINTTSF